MASSRGTQLMRLYRLKKKTLFDTEGGSQLPEAYRKFWYEWKKHRPTPVHYVAKEGKWTRNEETGEVLAIQNIPIPVRFPPEHNDGIWGGEGIVRGFVKRHPLKRRVPHFWFPTLKRSVLYSEVLDKYMSVVITNRTMDLIHENYGFDHYLLKTEACDLKSELALKLKRQILLSLSEKSLYPEDPVKRDEVYAKYEQYLSAYTPEELEWYGLNYREALQKINKIKAASIVITPLKDQFRAELIARLKEGGEEEDEEESASSFSWLSKINPLSKSTKTT